MLYTGKYLRKKYKDPITDEPFGVLAAGVPAGAAGRGSLGNGRASTAGSGRAGIVTGSIQGVYSTSTDNSIRVYQNQQRYIDWPFTFQTAQLQMGQARGRGAPSVNAPPGGNPGRSGGPGPGGRSGGPGIGPGGGPGRGGGLVPPGGPGRGGGQAPPGGGRGRGNH